MLIRRETARTPANLAATWQRLEAWLAAHAPEILADLRPGLPESEILRFEELVDLRLPDDVRESYRIHDGQGWFNVQGVLFGGGIAPLFEEASSIGAWRHHLWMCQELQAADSDWSDPHDWSPFPADAIKPLLVNPAWIPLQDWDGNCLGIDLDPAANGIEGQVINFGRDRDERVVAATSWAHFLEDVADELEGGNFVLERAADGRVEEFRPKEAPGHGLYAIYRPWAEAKLPLAFQAMSARPPQLPPIITGKLAEECASVVREFMRAMHEFEQHFLKVRPIRAFGFSRVFDGPGDEFSAQSIQGYGKSPVTIDPATGQLNVPVIKQMFVDVREAARKHQETIRNIKCRDEALRQRSQIIERFCTRRPRSGEHTFEQNDPPAYDPRRDEIAEVRQESDDHVIVCLKPFTRSRCHPPYEITERFHLVRIQDRWLIDTRDETRTGKVAFRVGLL